MIKEAKKRLGGVRIRPSQLPKQPPLPRPIPQQHIQNLDQNNLVLNFAEKFIIYLESIYKKNPYDQTFSNDKISVKMKYENDNKASTEIIIKKL